MVDPVLITAGANVLGGVLAGSSGSISPAQNVLSMERQSRMGFEWQDKHYNRTLRHTVGRDNYPSDDGDIYSGKGYDLLGRDRDLEYTGKHIDQSFDKLSERGLTPQEIAGSPVPGGARVSGGSNTLGNAVSSASQSRANAQTALSAQLLDSRTKLETTKMQTQAHLKGEMIKAGVNIAGQQTSSKTAMYVSNIASQTGRYNSTQVSNAQIEAAKIYSDTSRQNVLSQLKVKQKLDDAQIAKMSAQIALIKQDQRFKSVLHDERWEKLFSSMSAENVLASVLAARAGINIQDVLKGNVSKENISLLNFSQAASASKSGVRNTWHGYTSIGIEYAERVYDTINTIIDSMMSGSKVNQKTSKPVNQ